MRVCVCVLGSDVSCRGGLPALPLPHTHHSQLAEERLRPLAPEHHTMRAGALPLCVATILGANECLHHPRLNNEHLFAELALHLRRHATHSQCGYCVAAHTHRQTAAVAVLCLTKMKSFLSTTVWSRAMQIEMIISFSRFWNSATDSIVALYKWVTTSLRLW